MSMNAFYHPYFLSGPSTDPVLYGDVVDCQGMSLSMDWVLAIGPGDGGDVFFTVQVILEESDNGVDGWTPFISFSDYEQPNNVVELASEARTKRYVRAAYYVTYDVGTGEAGIAIYFGTFSPEPVPGDGSLTLLGVG